MPSNVLESQSQTGDSQLTWAACCPGKGWATRIEGSLSSRLGAERPEHPKSDPGRRPRKRREGPAGTGRLCSESLKSRDNLEGQGEPTF